MIKIDLVQKNSSSGLYQWDTDRKILITSDCVVDEVQFDSIYTKQALVVKPTVSVGLGGVVADIPNILLQQCVAVGVYVVAYTENGEHVTESKRFPVTRRQKPSDYVYTETEVMSYQDLERRVTELEQSGAGGGILKETDPTVPDWAKQPKKPSYTADEVGAMPEGSLDGYAKKTDYANKDNAGVVKVADGSSGLYMLNGSLQTSPATVQNIDSRAEVLKPITTGNLDYAVKKALSNCKLQEENAWTDEEKKSARGLIGVEGGKWKYIDTIEVENADSITINFPQGYDEFMINGDIEGNGASTMYPNCGYYVGDAYSSAAIFSDYYPGDKKEHYEFAFEKATDQNDVFFKVSGFESSAYTLGKIKNPVMTTGWDVRYAPGSLTKCCCWDSVRIDRTITKAMFKLYAR